MLFEDHLVVVRGGGDLATGTIYRLHRAGFPVLVLELQKPLAIRRTVAVASAVNEGRLFPYHHIHIGGKDSHELPLARWYRVNSRKNLHLSSLPMPLLSVKISVKSKQVSW